MVVGASIGRWSPGIGDPSVAGWLTVLAYFAAAWLCWRARGVAALERQGGAHHHSTGLWTAFAIGLGLLGVNKQLDLQSALTELGRILVRARGWEAHKATIQVVFIVSILFAGLVASIWLTVLARRDLRRMFLALLGGVELCAFVALRASSFHHVDRFIGLTWAGAHMNWILELGGIALIAIGALRYRTPSARR